MENKEFAVAFSAKEQEAAVKEASLKIKLIFPKHIDYLIVLFTPQYRPTNILKTIKLTVKPTQVLGMQSPFLMFEGEIIRKGVVLCCINKPGVEIKEFLLDASKSKEIESFLSSSFKKLKRQGFYFLSFVSHRINPTFYTKAMKSSIGKVFNLLGGGYLTKVSSYNSQIANEVIGEGLINTAIKGLKISSMNIEGYFPLGKPFTITKTTISKDVIIEINKKPAVEIFKYYLEEKFDTFIKNHLFSFYPLGLSENGTVKLVNVIECLADGSLACTGEVTAGMQGHIMFLNPASLLPNLKSKLAPLYSQEGGLIFIINSLVRKKILKDYSVEEIKLIKQAFGDKFKMIGLYCDYSFSSDEEQGDINLAAGKLLLTLWQ